MRRSDHAGSASAIALAAASCLAGVGCVDEPTRPPSRPPGHPVAAAPAVALHEVERLACTVVTAERRLACVPARGSAGDGAGVGAGVSADRLIGDQEVGISLTTVAWSYDAGTGILSNTVTVQSLVQQVIGTPDGATVTGVHVFFASPPVTTGGTGTVTVANADGIGNFTAPNQPYFLYNERLEPYEISGARTWRFNVPPSVTSFAFEVRVSAKLPDEDAPLLDAVWTGATSTQWALAANWRPTSAPDAAAVVAVPRATLVPSGRFPVLAGDVTAGSVRVGAGSSLALAGHVLTLTGNVDAPGEIGGGTVRLTGAGRVVGGTLPALQVAGSARVQRSTRATGPVSVTGALTVSEAPLAIVIP